MEKSPYASNTYHAGNENTVWSKIVRMVPVGSTVLDIGCSSGNLGAFLKAEKVAKVVDGIDIDDGDVELAKKKLDKAIIANIEADDISDLGMYDIIIFADVLEHMKDATKALEIAKSHLAPHGKILFSIPNMAHIYIRLQLLQGEFTYTETGLIDQTHLHFYNENEVRRIFAEAKLNIDLFDNTILDYPDDFIKEKLAVVGLKASETFLRNAHSLAATTFEFIGYATATKKVAKVELGTNSPLDEMIGFVQRVKDAEVSRSRQLEQKIIANEQHIEKLANAYAQAVEDNKGLQANLERANVLQRIRNHFK